ncbi:hypothetical protein [Photobacterium leiognathi]|uniref:hypothetical protein n=1 Tax=Photobacterium leiognathi TaxID=553611 RepID=UPI00273965DD|nr:hypothetical protein [Photobacterium leiognathi]
MNNEIYNFNTVISRHRISKNSKSTKITEEEKRLRAIRQQIELRKECIEAGIAKEDWSKIR